MQNFVSPTRSDITPHTLPIYLAPWDTLTAWMKAQLIAEIKRIGRALFGYEIRHEQYSAVYHIIIRRRLLLSLKTSAGKSTVAYLSGLMVTGVVVYISFLLSLGTQAYLKPQTLRGKSLRGDISGLNLDDARLDEERGCVLYKLSKSENNERATLFVFASPQHLLR